MRPIPRSSRISPAQVEMHEAGRSALHRRDARRPGRHPGAPLDPLVPSLPGQLPDTPGAERGDPTAVPSNRRVVSFPRALRYRASTVAARR